MTALRVGVLGLGNVFWQQYRGMLDSLARERRIELVAGFDPDPAKREALTRITGADGTTSDAEALITSDEIDVVLVLTGMGEHGRLALRALSAGKHVLVEKPMATSLEEAAQLVALSRKSPVRLVCAPHVALSPTYREIHRRIHAGVIGSVVLARARYGWSGPSWGKWFYERDGGCLFDLGVSSSTAATVCCRCSATTGRRRDSSSGGTRAAAGSFSRSRIRPGAGRRGYDISSTASRAAGPPSPVPSTLTTCWR